MLLKANNNNIYVENVQLDKNNSLTYYHVFSMHPSVHQILQLHVPRNSLELFLFARFDAYSKAFFAGCEPSTPTRIFESIYLCYIKVSNIVFD